MGQRKPNTLDPLFGGHYRGLALEHDRPALIGTGGLQPYTILSHIQRHDFRAGRYGVTNAHRCLKNE
jgi:hypothetical protein